MGTGVTEQTGPHTTRQRSNSPARDTRPQDRRHIQLVVGLERSIEGPDKAAVFVDIMDGRGGWGGLGGLGVPWALVRGCLVP